jgi:8-oxo-dGTP diphosphatase
VTRSHHRRASWWWWLSWRASGLHAMQTAYAARHRGATMRRSERAVTIGVNDLLTRLWRLGKPLQWRFLWLVHAKFICGITGVVRDEHGRVLLLRHRLWPPDRQWGFPTGYANKGERHEDTIAREVREETGLTVKAGRLLKVRSGFRYRIEVYYEAVLVGGLDGLTLDPKEVLEARLFRLGDLPDGMPEAHRELADCL